MAWRSTKKEPAAQRQGRQQRAAAPTAMETRMESSSSPFALAGGLDILGVALCGC